MGLIDIILSVILLAGFIRGFLHGFIHEIAVLGTIFICYFFGFKLSHILANYLNLILHVEPSTMYIVSVFIAWMAISIGIYFLAKLFEGLINIIALGPFNKIAGGIFGLLKYALVVSLVLFFINKLDINIKWLNADAKAKSYLYYKVLALSRWVI